MSKEANEVILEVKGLKKNFGSNQVLKGVDISIKKGEVIAIIAPSGCGKSTFIRCLNFLEQPDGGEIIYHGQDLMQLDKKKRHEALKGVGMVFQQFNLFPHKTVVDNITMAPKLVQGMKKEEARKRDTKLCSRLYSYKRNKKRHYSDYR